MPPTERADLQPNKHYIIVHNPVGRSLIICNSAGSYFHELHTSAGRGLPGGSISHAFPSLVESEAYARGAGLQWPIQEA